MYSALIFFEHVTFSAVKLLFSQVTMYQDPNEHCTVGLNTLPEKQLSQTQPSHGLQHVPCCAATEPPDGREDKT